jgi:uncharacterized membrane protein
MNFWSIWATVISFGSVGVLLMVAVLAPSVLPVIAEYAKPVASKLGELTGVFISWLVNILRVGAPHIARSTHAAILVALLMGSVWLYKDWTQPQVDTPATCQKVIKDLRKNFNITAKKKPQVSITQPSTWWPF